MLGAEPASTMSLGRPLAVLTFFLTLVVIVLTGFDVPSRLNRLVDPRAVPDYLAPERVTDAAGAVGWSGCPDRRNGTVAGEAPRRHPV
ncbi:hypothetical protein ACFW40_21045 [Streptomyces sp. NPDC058807]|uniref:hypothetical protein n=1 Tax=unclassified Streptomyces TaxID=2593676 RepID=UPI003693E84C